MRVINLDETGIKLLNNKKNQIYLNRDELTDFVNGNYAIINNKLTFKNKTLNLSESEIKEFPTILSYLRTLLLYK